MADERPINKQQLDELFAHLLTFAHQTLEKHGEFLPFGASMGTDRLIKLAAGYTGSGWPPNH